MNDAGQTDSRAREEALDPRHSFIVQAPAGSGKTTVLTQRYLRLLTTVEEPEQVLAITFTRKAAGEMRERVQKALEGDIAVRSAADAKTLELAQAVRVHAAARRWGLEDSSARLRIQTIDSFNAYLANAMPLTSGSGFGRGIADAPDDLYALAARETLRHAETDPDLRVPFERILRRLDDSWMRLERLIAGMLSRRAEWLPNLPQLSGEPLVPPSILTGPSSTTTTRTSRVGSEIDANRFNTSTRLKRPVARSRSPISSSVSAVTSIPGVIPASSRT